MAAGNVSTPPPQAIIEAVPRIRHLRLDAQQRYRTLEAMCILSAMDANSHDSATIWDVNERLHFDEPLDPGDERWVDTSRARGEFSFEPFYRKLGVDSSEWRLRGAPIRGYILFCGHRGCGKSTELRRIYKSLNTPAIFLVILVDAAEVLDPNNLQYQDVLMALAEALLEDLVSKNLAISDVYLARLIDWFNERIVSHDSTRQFAAEIQAGVAGETGIPFLSKLFASLTTAFRVNSTYKEELRRVVRNNFSEFAEAFNQLVLAAEQASATAGHGRRILFLVDGTDRLRGEDAESFFIRDAHQLQLINALFVYSTPIHLIHTGAALKESFTGTFKLPMVKLYDPNALRIDTGFDAMRRILFGRAPVHLFDENTTVDYLVKHSGGHPRDLLRLLQYSFEYATGEIFDRQSAEKAVAALATDYRVFLDAEDYSLLKAIDAHPSREYNSERVRHLLYNLALLEYDSYWWQSHPVVRTLDAYSNTRPIDDRGGH